MAETQTAARQEITRSDLVNLIREHAGEAAEAAFNRLQERRTAAAATAAADIVARVDVEGRAGDFANNRSLAGERRALALGGALFCLAVGKGDRDKAIQIAKSESWKAMPDVEKILSAGDPTQAGVLIAPEHSLELIDLLAARTVVRRHIANTVDVSAGSIDMPRLTADAATSWGGEVEEIREGNPTTDQLVMRAFQQKTLVPISNTLLRRGGPRIAALVRNSTLRSMALGEDRVFITSPGSEHRPKGLRFWAPDSTNRLVATAFSGTEAQKLTAVTGDLGRMILVLEEANVPMTAPLWIFAPRTKQYLLTVRDGNGNFVYREEMLKGTLWGIPYETTTHVARNEGSGADESYVYLLDSDEFMLGQGQSLQVDMSTEGTYVDADGNVVSAFQRNLTLLRIINEVDLRPQHQEAIVTLSGVKWAPSA